MQQQVWATYMTTGLYRAPSRVFDCSSTLSLRTGQGVCESRSSWRRARACPLTVSMPLVGGAVGAVVFLRVDGGWDHLQVGPPSHGVLRV
jgi:hypothetical protein